MELKHNPDPLFAELGQALHSYQVTHDRAALAEALVDIGARIKGGGCAGGLHSWQRGRNCASIRFARPARSPQPRYNIAPSQDVAAVRLYAAGQHELAMLRWGLVPSWAKDEKVGYKMINARAETVADKQAFRRAFRRRRCLIPASGFYEWQPRTVAKQPYYITRADGRPLAFVGLWERWDKGDAPVESCAIIVTAANDLLRPIHDRMPVILQPADFAAWPNPAPPAAEAKALMRPAPVDALRVWPVSTMVNKTANDDPALIEPVAE